MTQADLEQGMSFLESLVEEMTRRAVERYAQQQPERQESLWVEGAEAAEIMGAGYTLPRLKQMGHAGEIVMDRKDPDKPNSPYIFLRSSLLEYSARRVFQLDQSKARPPFGRGSKKASAQKR